MTRTDAPTTTASDVQLARRIGAGDPAAFVELHRRHDARLRRIAAAVLRDPQEAEDAAQETWMRAASRIGGVEEPAAWLATVVRHEALRLHARRARRAVPVETLPEVRDPDADPANVVALAERRRAVHSALAGLDPVYRESALRELCGQKPAEVAAALGISPVAARVRAHRARRMIAERLGAAGLAA